MVGTESFWKWVIVRFAWRSDDRARKIRDFIEMILQERVILFRKKILANKDDDAKVGC